MLKSIKIDGLNASPFVTMEFTRDDGTKWSQQMQITAASLSNPHCEPGHNSVLFETVTEDQSTISNTDSMG